MLCMGIGAHFVASGAIAKRDAKPVTVKARHHHSSSSKHSHHKCNNTHSKTSIVTTQLIPDVISNANPLTATIGDPNMSVGPSMLISAVNEAVTFTNKTTQQKQTFFLQEFGIIPDPVQAPCSAQISNFGDPVVFFDELSGRYFISYFVTYGFYTPVCGEFNIDTPESIAGTYPSSPGLLFPGPFDITGNIVPTVPANANLPLTNGPAINGNIALIAADGFTSIPGGLGSIGKCQNATDAGAVGCVIYLDPGDVTTTINGSDSVPSMAIDNTTGNLILANLPATVTLKTEPIPIDLQYTVFPLAVSINSNPQGPQDFYHYVVGSIDGPYNSLFGDYVKLGVDKDALYYSGNSFAGLADTPVPCFSQIVAVEKAPLLIGPSGRPVNILYDTKEEEQVEGFSLRLPAYTRYTKKEKEHFKPKHQVEYFVSCIFDDPEQSTSGSSLEVTAISNILSGSPVEEKFIVPVKPWTIVTGSDDPAEDGDVPQQPGPFSADDFNPRLSAGVAWMMYRAVAYDGSLWCAHTVGGPDIFEVRWYEIDVSKWHKTGLPDTKRVRLHQQGTIQGGGTTSAFYPSIDVDKDGNMGIGFNICGPNQPVSFGYTGRLKCDPKGEVKLPYQVAFVGTDGLPFFNNFIADYDFVFQRWNDYVSLVLDPVDHKTFRYFSQYSDLNEEQYFSFEGTWNDWKAGAVAFQVRDGECKKKLEINKNRLKSNARVAQTKQFKPQANKLKSMMKQQKDFTNKPKRKKVVRGLEQKSQVVAS